MCATQIARVLLTTMLVLLAAGCGGSEATDVGTSADAHESAAEACVRRWNQRGYGTLLQNPTRLWLDAAPGGICRYTVALSINAGESPVEWLRFTSDSEIEPVGAIAGRSETFEYYPPDGFHLNAWLDSNGHIHLGNPNVATDSPADDSLPMAPLSSDPACLQSNDPTECFGIRPESWGGWNAGLTGWHWSRWDSEGAEGSGRFIFHAERDAVPATARLSDPGTCDGVHVFLRAEVRPRGGPTQIGQMRDGSCIYDRATSEGDQPSSTETPDTEGTDWYRFGWDFCKESGG